MKHRVVVTGMGAVSPVGITLEATWKRLIAGESGIDGIASFDLTSVPGLESTIAGEVTNFDAVEHFGRKESRRMDRFVQLAAVAAVEAAQNAKVSYENINPERTSVIIGTCLGGIITLSEQLGVMEDRGVSRVSPFLVPMMLPDMASGQVSMLLGAKGPNYGISSACSSGSDALGSAFRLVQDGRIDVALAGGSEAPICPVGIAGFNSCKALSTTNENPQKASRPFDAGRNGFVLSEGAGMLVMESEKSAFGRGVEPIAEIIGYGATADAYHVTQPAPNGEGSARAMRVALRDAGIRPDEIEYINAHGTSTLMNDRYETIAIKAVFGESGNKTPVSSTKSMTGHLLGASGALEAVVSIMSISKGVLAPTINLEVPDPECDLDYVPNVARQVEVKTVMSNSFGFGGHNSSLIFRKYVP